MNSRDKINYPESYFEIITVDNVNSQEMMNRIRIVLDCLIKNLDKVEEIINKQIPEPFSPSTPEKVESSSWKIEQYQCCSYLQIMSVLVELSQQEIIPDEGTEEKNSIQITNQPVDYHRIIEFSHFLIKHSHPYDVDIRYTTKSLKDKMDDEFIDGICVTLFEESNNETNENKPNTLMMVSSRIRNVIEILLPVIEKKNSLKESTIEKYARTLCFSNMIQMFQYQEFVPRFITILTKLNKSTVMKIIDNDLDQLCKNNIISVLFALKTMNEKRDISNYLESCLSYKYFSYDDFIQLFVECNSGILPNLKQLFWLLNTSYYSLPTRKAIWKYLTDCNTDYLIFKNHFMNKDYGKSNGDYIEISMFLISRFDKENQQEKNEIINHLVEMSICYMDVFALSYDILKKNALEQIKDKEFIKSLFCQKIGHNDVVFIDYCRNVAFPSLTKEEINVYFNIMFDFVLQNLKSYNIILNDPVKGAFDETIDNDNNDLTDVIVSLSFMVNMKFCPLNQIKQTAKEIVEKLSNADIWEKIKNNKIEKLKKALIDIQTF